MSSPGVRSPKHCRNCHSEVEEDAMADNTRSRAFLPLVSRRESQFLILCPLALYA